MSDPVFEFKNGFPQWLGIALLGLLPLLVGGAMLWGHVRGVATTVRTTGEVVAAEEVRSTRYKGKHGRPTTTAYARVRFRDPATGRTHDFELRGEDGGFMPLDRGEFQAGDPIPVAYERGDPYNARIDRGGPAVGMGAGLFGVGAVFTGIAFVAWRKQL